MKKVAILQSSKITLSVLTLALVLVTMSNVRSVSAVDTGNDNSTVKADNNNTNYIHTGRTIDDNLKVGNFSFRRVYHPSGQGEYLDVYFDIHNLVDRRRNLKVFFFGFWEDDRSKTKFRKYTVYPTWRKRDYDKEVKDILFLDAKPELNKAEVYDYILKNKPKGMAPAKDFGRTPDGKAKEGKDLRYDEHADFLDYIQYIVSNPDKGIDLEVWGSEQNKIEKESDYLKEVNGFTLVNQALKTVAMTKLYSKFRADRKFFNHVGVILYDRDDKKIVYSQYIRFTKQLKMQ